MPTSEFDRHQTAYHGAMRNNDFTVAITALGFAVASVEEQRKAANIWLRGARRQLATLARLKQEKAKPIRSHTTQHEGALACA